MTLQNTVTVPFNPDDSEHRAAVRAFMKRNAWGDTCLRFTHNNNYRSIADQVKQRLLEWYMAQEAENSK